MAMFGPPEGACPSAGELALYVARRLTPAEEEAIVTHLAQCLRCPDIVQNLRVADSMGLGTGVSAVPSAPRMRDTRLRSAAGARRFGDLLQLSRPDRLRFGQYWTIAAPQETLEVDAGADCRMVVLLADDDTSATGHDATVLTAPISLDLAYRSQDDLLVRGDEGPLGYDVIIEAWNTVTVLRDQLVRYTGTLQQPAKRHLGLLCQAQLGLNVDLTELAWRRGPAILDPADPRVQFQEQEILACAHLRRPALRALEAVVEVAPEAVVDAQPFAGIVAEGKARGLTLPQIAERLRLTPALVRKLDLRSYRYGPGLRNVAAFIGRTLGWDTEALARYLQQTPALAPHASFRADQAPETQEQQDFADALRADARLSDEQRERWLHLLETGEQELPPG